MDIQRMQKLSGINGGTWKEVNSPKTSTSQATSKYNSDSKNKSATDVRDVSGSQDINQDVAAEMDTTSKEHTDTAKGQVEVQQHTISVDDNGAPKVDDTTSVETTDPADVANESENIDGDAIVESTDDTDDVECDECPDDCECEKCMKADDSDEINESAGNVNMKKYGNAVKAIEVKYNVSPTDAAAIVYALQGGVSRESATALSKIVGVAIKTKDELGKHAATLFDAHPELQQELMEKEVATVFETEYNSLKSYVTSARNPTNCGG